MSPIFFGAFGLLGRDVTGTDVHQLLCAGANSHRRESPCFCPKPDRVYIDPFVRWESRTRMPCQDVREASFPSPEKIKRPGHQIMPRCTWDIRVTKPCEGVREASSRVTKPCQDVREASLPLIGENKTSGSPKYEPTLGMAGQISRFVRARCRKIEYSAAWEFIFK